jgi:hypothetical protein
MNVRDIQLLLVGAATHVTAARGLVRAAEAQLPERTPEQVETIGCRDPVTALRGELDAIGREQLAEAGEALLAAVAILKEDGLDGR